MSQLPILPLFSSHPAAGYWYQNTESLSINIPFSGDNPKVTFKEDKIILKPTEKTTLNDEIKSVLLPQEAPETGFFLPLGGLCNTSECLYTVTKKKDDTSRVIDITKTSAECASSAGAQWEKCLQLDVEKQEDKNQGRNWWGVAVAGPGFANYPASPPSTTDSDVPVVPVVPFYAKSPEEIDQEEVENEMVKRLPGKVGEQAIARSEYTGGSTFNW